MSSAFGQDPPDPTLVGGRAVPVGGAGVGGVSRSDVLDRPAEWPNSGAQVHRAENGVDERIVGVAGFPHVVRYRVIGDMVAVMAIYDERRRPGFGSGRAT